MGVLGMPGEGNSKEEVGEDIHILAARLSRELIKAEAALAEWRRWALEDLLRVEEAEVFEDETLRKIAEAITSDEDPQPDPLAEARKAQEEAEDDARYWEGKYKRLRRLVEQAVAEAEDD